MGQVIHLHQTRPARAQGVALAVAIAAERLGCSPERAVILAKAASLRFLGGTSSAAKVVSDEKARLLRDTPKVLA